MRFNDDKCHVLILGKLGNIRYTQVTKDLGTYVYSELSFDDIIIPNEVKIANQFGSRDKKNSKKICLKHKKPGLIDYLLNVKLISFIERPNLIINWKIHIYRYFRAWTKTQRQSQHLTEKDYIFLVAGSTMLIMGSAVGF